MIVSWILYEVYDFDKRVDEAEDEEPMLIMRMETRGLGDFLQSTVFLFLFLHLSF